MKKNRFQKYLDEDLSDATPKEKQESYFLEGIASVWLLVVSTFKKTVRIS